MDYCDKNRNVLEWSSEEHIIPYKDPVQKKWRRYFPDFWIRVKTSDGTIKESVIEIKPKVQTSPPKGGPPVDRRKKRRYLREIRTWGINEAKWKAAKHYCELRNWKFQILTEDNLTNY